MNETVNYINQQYKEDIKDHTYINKKNISIIQIGFYLVAICKNNLKLTNKGKIIFINENYNFIRIYNNQIKKYSTIYPDYYYIFVRKQITKKDIFKKNILNFIKEREISR